MPRPRQDTINDTDAYAADIAAKVQFLFETFRKPNTDRYTYLDVETGSNGGITNSYISKLLHGEVKRPSLRSLKALTDFFNVDSSFWFNDLNQEVKMHADALSVPEDAIQIALRSGDLSDEDRRFLLDMIDVMEKRRRVNRSNPQQKSEEKGSL